MSHPLRRFALPMLLAFLIAGLSAAHGRGDAPRVNQSGRAVPVAERVDVLVVGGSTGAVSAALEAAQAGAQVFLMAPYPYLGEDMTATLRLWLDEDERPDFPLAAEIFSDPDRSQETALPDGLSYSYKTDVPSSSRHKDTSPPALLSDGKASSASNQSVQYDDDVTITADLGEPQQLAKVRLISYQRLSSSEVGDNFSTKQMTVSVSEDGENWRELGTAETARPMVTAESTTDIVLPVDVTARYVRVHVERGDNMERMLLGELLLLPPREAKAKDDKPRAFPSPRPMHVKRTLDRALLEAGVTFLYSCYPTDVVRDENGDVCGVVMANRSGRQAVLAKTIIDATHRGEVARMAGASARPFPGGQYDVEFVVIGGEPVELESGKHATKGAPFYGPWPNKAQTESGTFPVINYTIPVELPDSRWATWCQVEEAIRAATYHPDQQFTADVFYLIPPDPVLGQVSYDDSPDDLQEIPLAAFVPRHMDHLFVLGPAADVSRDLASRLARPLAYMSLGRRIGQAAARDASTRKPPMRPRVAGPPPAPSAVPGDVGEMLKDVRISDETGRIDDPARSLPVLGEYDVVVVGGGTAGAPAGIGAARQGAKTLVVEYLHGLGGVGTMGAISSYYWGNRVGFTATMGASGSWVIEHKKHWYRTELDKAGAEIWYGTLGCGAFGQDNQVQGVVVATPRGRGVVLAHTVIDTTGNSDIAAAAGVPCMYTGADSVAMQGTGLPPRNLGASYANTDFTIVDETDILDVWHVFVYAKDKYASAFDQGKLIDTRERRRIIGDFVMSLLDQLNHRTYPDTVCRSYSNFDTHGYTVEPYLELEHPEKVGHYVNIPYRSMLPRGFEGLLVGGLGMSCHRDAIPLVRMQADLQNQGYALGCAAAMAASRGVSVRDIDLRQLQLHLVEIGNIPEEVLVAEDNFPPSEEELRAAVATLPDQFQGAHVVMWAPDKSHDLVREAFEAAESQAARRAYAQTLAVMGDPLGVDLLIDDLRGRQQWDAGWNYRGMGQFGSALSEMDRLVVAIGRAGDPKGVPAIIEKLRLLQATDDFSHHRACATALEMLGDPAAAEALATHLEKPDMQGHAHLVVAEARARDQASPEGTNAVKTRRDSLRELITARALFRCGDHDGLGRRILKMYTEDLRGHLARHAQAVLNASQK